MTIAITFQNVETHAPQKYKRILRIPQTYKVLSCLPEMRVYSHHLQCCHYHINCISGSYFYTDDIGALYSVYYFIISGNVSDSAKGYL